MVQYLVISIVAAVIAAVLSVWVKAPKVNLEKLDDYKKETFNRAAKALERIRKIVLLIVFGVVGVATCLTMIFGMPTLSMDTYNIAVLALLVGAAIIVGNIAVVFWYNDDLYESDFKARLNWIAFVPFGVSLLFFSYAFFASCSMIGNNSKRLQSILQVEVMRSDSILANEIAPTDIEHVISVDDVLAKRIAESKLGQVPSLGSRVKVGKMSIQNLTGSFTIKDGEGRSYHLSFKNEQVWVAPLEHINFWRWKDFRTTPGYMLVSAVDRQKAYYVKEVEGQEIKLRYIESGCFPDYILRHVRGNGYIGKILAEADFEIDNQGAPHMIYTMLEPKVGLRGMVPTGVIVTDAQTGAINEYNMEQVPAWIDIVVPEDIVEKTIDWWGEYQKGYWNACFAKDSVQLATPGTTNLYNKGRTYWYTGVQSAGKDLSTSGFMMVDSRNMKAKLYPKAGITEEKAMRIAMGQPGIKEAGYYATVPIPYNVNGLFSYFMTLKDSMSGEIMAYAFVSVENMEMVGTGKSKTEAERNYINCAMRVSNDVLKDGEVVHKTNTYTIRSIANEGSNYYVVFEEVKGIEFLGSSEFFRDLRYAEKGHKVEVSFDEGKGAVVRITSFKNLSFEI